MVCLQVKVYFLSNCVFLLYNFWEKYGRWWATVISSFFNNCSMKIWKLQQGEEQVITFIISFVNSF